MYRIGNVGDTVCALPAIYAVHQAYPDAHLTLVTSPGPRHLPSASDLLSGADWLDDIFVYYAEDVADTRARLRLVRELRKRAFDVWFEIPQDVGFITCLRNMLVARAAGPRWAHGWRMGTVKFARQAQSEFAQAPNEVERLIRAVEAAGLPPVTPAFPLPLTEEHRRTVDRLLNTELPSDGPLVAIAPGAKRSTNRWPVSRFAEVGRHLANHGCRIVVLGSPSERELCAKVVEAVNHSALSLAGRISLLESCEVLKRCNLLICNDSGPQHLAAAVGTSCVSLFSFWQVRGKWRPYGSQHTVLQKWVKCHTCYLNTCPRDNLCINLIAVDEVIDRADRKLREQRKTASPAPMIRERA